ncbi:fibronectin type III domain-containing protein [Rhodobacteraceae bacterium F11138]|nr:fibronectin type III domain-containing protein [Rhodobacteraceae bacterium F11138]
MPDTLADDVFGLGTSGAASAFFVVSVSGLTTSPTYGQTAQIGTPLYASAHHFSDAAPSSVTWQWHNSTGEIAGATSAAYTPAPGDNLENIYPEATPLGPYASQNGPAYTVRFAAPMVAGVLPDASYSVGTGNKTVMAASGFSGENLTYGLQTDIPGVTLDSGTGIVTVPTLAEVSGTVTVTAINSGGTAQSAFEVEVIDDVVTGPPFTVDVGGLTDGIARIGSTVSAEIMWNIPAGEILRYRWRSNGEVIRGARSRTYLVDEAYDATKLSVTITTVEDGAKTTARYPVQYEAPVAAGNLPAKSFDTGSGAQTVNAAPDFTGSGLAYSVDSAIAGVTIDSGTGIVTIPTLAVASGTVTVTAANSGGAAQSTFDVSIAHPQTVPDRMPAPTVTAAGPTSLQVDLGAAPQDGGSPITSYDLSWREENGAYADITGVSDPAFLTGLQAGVVYQIRTRAVNAVGSGQWSPSETGVPEESSPSGDLPDIVANTDDTVDIMVDEGSFSLTVSGSGQAHHNGTHGPFASSDLDSGPISVMAPDTRGTVGVGKSLEGLPGLWTHQAGDMPAITGKWSRNGVDIPGATGSTYMVNEADGGETITYAETATNSAGSRTRAATGIVIPVAAVPEQMAAPTVTATGPDGISVSLAAAPNDGGSAITSYDLRWRTQAGSWTVVTGITDPEAIGGLAASTLYNVQTRAVNMLGNGAWSTSGTAATAETGGGSVFVDTFDYADGTLLESRPEWSDQYSLGGSVEVRSGAAQLVSGGTQWLKCSNVLAPDQFVEAVVTESSAGGGHTLCVRQTGPASYYGLRCKAGGVSLVREGPSGYTELWVGAVVQAGDTIRLEAEGTTIRYVLNGILTQTVTDSDVTAGSASLLMDGTAKIDQFSCGEL